jgi:eukaryotic-like serine/threonine-protein kinase
LALTPGTRLGVYEITALVGEGGMGRVFRATDTKLKRQVAIKILPPALAADHDRLARFQREAEVLASLNHPHIAGIYGLEESAGVTALVMELVEGEDLSQRIARGALPLDETLPIAKQIADALEAAHAQGIVHRDLKPANIKLRPDGTVKVLDFGLAKSLLPAGADEDPAHSPTITAATRAGVILGTAAYMSPEQARGRATDKRADLWAFGCIVYELITGRPVFARDTLTDTIAAVVTTEPDWTRLPASTPAGLRRLLRRCLEKDPKRRLRDIADARLDIEEALADETVLPGQTQPRKRSLAGVGAGLVIGGAIAAIAVFSLVRRSQPVAPEYSRVVRLTSGPAREYAPAISPDGKWVAYLSDAGGEPNVWVKFLAGGEPINLTAGSGLIVSSGSGIGGLEISPDGARVAVMARSTGVRQQTYEIPAPLPGKPRKVLEDNMLGMRWSPDGRHITFINAGGAAGDALWVADADGTNRRQLITAQDGMHVHWPAWSDDGYIYFLRTFNTVSNLDRSEIYRIDAAGGRPMEPVVETLRRAQYPVPLGWGRGLIYAANPLTADMTLWWRGADRRQMRQIVSGIGEYAEVRASADGSALVSTLYEMRQSLIRIAANAAKPTTSAITDGYHGDLDPMVSPAGDRVVFSSSRDGNRHIWVARVDGSDARPLTSGNAEDHRPVFSPDGQQVAFASDRGGGSGIWLIAADGGSLRKVVQAVLNGGLTWTRDGRFIVYGAAAGDGPALFKVAAAGGAPERLPTPFFATEPAMSPVRDVIAYIATKREGTVATSLPGFIDMNGQVLYASLPDRPGGGGFANGFAAWAPDGRRLAVVREQANSPSEIWLLELEGAQPYTKLVTFPPGPRIRGITWTADGSGIIIGEHDWTSDILLLDSPK